MARTAFFLALAGLLSACSGDPIDPASISRPDETQSGPGLLTGPDGAYDVQL